MRSIAGIDLVEFGGGVVSGARPLIALVGLIGSRRRDQPDAAFGQRFFQRRKRHLGIMRPAIGGAITERLVIGGDALPVGDRRIVLGRKPEPVLFAIGHRWFLR